MKKNLLFVVFVLVLSFIGCSSSKNNSVASQAMPQSALQGVWQLSKEFPAKEMLLSGYNPIVYSTYKIVDRIGDFTNIIRNNRGTYITANGTYSFSESEYTEHVVRSFTSPEFSGTDNKMTYEILHNKFLILKYPVGGGRYVNELWVRVPYGNPLN
ncbi:DUF4488 domain-containing protein [Paludibacter sp. 221]|uniref:DUF4488 domain-containing protein n=1 Tax=Paludibacter sp. 221 TaxID=2302939 RepID=UPI0013D770CA|nr:DUF4488 domain-containing protein [Paludibacter sp. 221]NDV46722.1 DUF4488 domain-containing protein [Paludibacter sp. 221]